MSIPSKDSELVAYGTNFSDRLTATPLVFNCTAANATQLSGLLTPFKAAYDTLVEARAAGNLSKSLTTAKNDSREPFLDYLRQLYARIAADMTVSDPNKDLMGITIRRLPSPIPAPTAEPALDIVSVNGRTVKVRIHDAAGDGTRSKPAGVKNASFFSAVAPEAPTDPAAYKWEGISGKRIVEIQFPESADPGARVWITAVWQNESGQTGPACTAIGTNIEFGGLSEVG